MNNAGFEKTMENVRKFRDINYNRKKKKLFGISTKLLCYRVVYRTFISNTNEKNRDI